MKKLLTVILLAVLWSISDAQPYRNEWIDYSKTYFKFKVGSNGLFRISHDQLTALGIGNTNVQDFKLWRNGTEVPLFTSVTSGSLSSGGFIEFYGKRNDGHPDTELYPFPIYQPSTSRSLFSDTAAYFLTVSPGTSNSRITGLVNNLTNPGTPDSFCIYKLERAFEDQIWAGNAAYIQGEYVRSATFDKGEGFLSSIFNATNVTFNNLKAYPSPGRIKIQTKGFGSFIGVRKVYCRLNNSMLDSTFSYSYDGWEINNDTIPTTRIVNDAISLDYNINVGTWNNGIMFSTIKITYPRTFEFNGMSEVPFSLPPSSNGSYLEINNFNSGGANPVLYDITYNKRYECQISGNTVRVKLQPSVSEHSFILCSTASINSAGSFTAKTFTNYSTAANQGNYLIISNSKLNSGANNQVQAYQNYRASVAGGGFNAKIIDIDELTDQFAYGIKIHPLSIRNFLRFARATFATSPKFALLIGHGLDYISYRYNPGVNAEILNMVPTWGNPGSDNSFSSAAINNPRILTPIGRISVTNNTELQNYLAKVIEYEQQQASTSYTQAAQKWKKQVLHLIGASDIQTGNLITPMMENYKRIIMDTLAGAEVHSYIKANNPNLTQSTAEVSNYINSGVALLTYFGHSSTTSLDFNLNNPTDYTNSNGRYPVFIANGCNAGNFFAYDPNRISGLTSTISEKFVLSPYRGSIAFIASTHFGVVNTLDYLTAGWYNAASKSGYGKSLGEIQQLAVLNTWNIFEGDYYTRLTLEETTINGDPAIKPFAQNKPDYSIEPANIKINPAFISAADDSFNVMITPYNLGKAVKDTLYVKIERKLPNGTIRLVSVQRFIALKNTATINLNVPITGNLEKGINQIIVSLDPQNAISEITDTNNVATKEFLISDEEIRPVYPYNYSIVNTPNFKLAGSTVNPMKPLGTYRMQIDTTEYFNSPLLYSADSVSVGGVVEFTPATNLLQGKVYYWRLSSIVSGTPTNWRNSSFLYDTSASEGWNQSHLYQLSKSAYNRMSLDTGTGVYNYGTRLNNLFITHSKYPESGGETSHFSISVNGVMTISSACVGSSVIFSIFDTLAFKPRLNLTQLYGSAPNCGGWQRYNFEFRYTSPAERKKIMDFIDSIPNGYYVTAKLNLDPTYNPNTGGWDYFMSLANTWKADTAIYGSGKSAYHSLQAQGAQLDNINEPAGRIWAMVFRKNDGIRFPTKFFFSNTVYDRITAAVDCPTVDTLGYITSPAFGPAKSWQQVQWNGHSVETSNPADSVLLSVIGVKRSGVETVLFTKSKAQPQFDISTVSADTFPYIKLQLRNQDPVNASPWHLDYWRIKYTPVAEGGVAPNLYFAGADTASVDSIQLSKYAFGVAFKNVSKVAFDSVKVKVNLTDSLGHTSTITLPKVKPIGAGDTARVYFELNTDTMAGTYNMMVDVNPDNDQPEQLRFNNFIYKSVVVLRSADMGICPGSSIVYKADLTGSTYQWQVDTGTGFINITDGAVYNGVATSSIRLSAPPTYWYGYKYRCVVNSGSVATYSNTYTLRFSVKWYGSQSTAWENTANWSCGVLPDEFTDVILNSSVSRYPVVNSAAVCRSLKALPNTSLRVTTGNSIKVAGKPGN